MYLDSDLITETDILTLFNQEFENKKLIAVPDTLPHLKYEKGVEHLINDLKLKNIRNYFNSGVLLFNIQAIEPLNHLQNMKKTFKTTKLIFPDQDILNVIFEDEVKLISNKWNYSCGVFTYAKYFLNQIEDEEYKNDFLEAKTNPKIIHFSSKLKPWNYRLIEYFDRFWYYARKTPFYTKLLCDIKTLNISSLQEETALI